MTQEDKKLLLGDLCARLPYNVVIRCTDNDTDYKCFLTTDILNELQHNIEYYDYKPYLRPMSSMTKEEKEELYHYYCKEIADNLSAPNLTWELRCCVSNSFGTDWLNAHHFDYRGLIEKGLALEAPEEMYRTE